MTFSKSWTTGSDSEKSALAKAIISGKDDNEASDNPAEEALEGEWDGSLRVEDADNGVIVTHTRHVKKPRKGHTSTDGKSEPAMDTEYRDHKRVFDKNDHKGLTGHILSVVKSPRKKGNRW